MSKFLTDRRTVTEVDPAHHLTHTLPAVLEAVTLLNSATDQLHRTVAGDRGVLLSGAVAKQLPNGTSYRLSASAGRLMGWSFQEASAGAFKARLHDGIDANGDVLAVIQCQAGVPIRDAWFGPGGIAFGQGLFVEVLQGVTDGSFYLGNAR